MFNRVGGVLLIWDNDGMRPSSSTCATGWEEHVVAPVLVAPSSFSLQALLQFCSAATYCQCIDATSNWIRNGSVKRLGLVMIGRFMNACKWIS